MYTALANIQNKTFLLPAALAVRKKGVRSSSMVRAFAHGAMGRRIDPSWGGERGVAPW